jgi:hypothetical protein
MLKVGLLWFDDDLKRPLVARLDEAVERYEERFGARPTLVHLNPAQVEGLVYRRLKVLGDAHLRRNHFLLGMEEAESPIENGPVAVAAAPASQSAGGANSPEPAPREEVSPPRRSRASRARRANPSLGDVRQRASRRAS